jgi:hypothetical protein
LSASRFGLVLAVASGRVSFGEVSVVFGVAAVPVGSLFTAG